MRCNISGKSFLETLATTRESLNMRTTEIAESGSKAAIAATRARNVEASCKPVTGHSRVVLRQWPQNLIRLSDRLIPNRSPGCDRSVGHGCHF